MKKRPWRRGLSVSIVRHVVLYIAAAVAILPLCWLLVSSIKPEVAITTIPPQLVFRPILKNYIAIWKENFGRYLSNSLVLSLSAAVLTIILGVPAAYGLARFRFPGRQAARFGVLALRFLPYISIVLPLYLLMRDFRLIGTHIGVILSYQVVTLPIVVWMLLGFFQQLPIDAEEAGMLDGLSRRGAFLRIALPSAAPGLGASFILSFIFSWNQFLFPLMLAGRDAKPLTVGLARYAGPGAEYGIRWGALSAWAFLTVIPVVVFSLIVHKYLSEAFGGGTTR